MKRKRRLQLRAGSHHRPTPSVPPGTEWMVCPAHTVPSGGKCSRDSRRNLKCLKFWWGLGVACGEGVLGKEEGVKSAEKLCGKEINS